MILHYLNMVFLPINILIICLQEKPILDSNNFIKDPVELSGCGIIVKPDSAQAIADGINQFYNMTAENRQKIGQLGQKYVIENHNIEFLANKYSKLFSS